MKPRPRAARSWERSHQRAAGKPPGRSGLKRHDAAAIAKRVRQCIKLTGCTSIAHLAAAADIADSTLKGWIIGKPKAPDVANLLTFARRMGISLDWLLLGATEDPFLSQNIGAEHQDLGDALRSRVVAQLRPHFRRFPGVLAEATPSGEKLIEAAVVVARRHATAAASERARRNQHARLQQEVAEEVARKIAELVAEPSAKRRAAIAARFDPDAISQRFTEREYLVDRTVDPELEADLTRQAVARALPSTAMGHPEEPSAERNRTDPA